MKIYMDRVNCPCWLGACEASFGWRLEHLRDGEFFPGGCMVEAKQDGKKSFTFLIHEHGGDKVLKVTEKNWQAAYDSWYLLWQKESVGGPN